MVDKITLDSPAGSTATVKTPENLVVVNPDKPPYSVEHLCIYMRELLDEAEKELEAANKKR